MKKLIMAMAALLLLNSFGGQVESYFTMENDTFLRRDDSDYTHGTGLVLIDEQRFHYVVQ